VKSFLYFTGLLHWAAFALLISACQLFISEPPLGLELGMKWL
jgi:hypothetical protein